MDFEENLQSEDKAVFDAIECELKRQQNQIELIASENIVSNAVLEAQGSIMTNKYAEGYPAHRYYGGCECVDVAVCQCSAAFGKSGQYGCLCCAAETMRRDYGHVAGCGRTSDARFKGFFFGKMAAGGSIRRL